MTEQENQHNLSAGEQYFRRAGDWYFYKYLYPLSERSFVATIVLILTVVATIIALNLIEVTPISTQVRYFVNSQSTSGKRMGIIHADSISGNPQKSLNSVLASNYVTKRETYESDKFESQEIFVANNSSDEVREEFYQFTSIDNSSSPKLKYGDKITRSVKIISLSHPDDNRIEVKFESLAQDNNGRVNENLLVKAEMEFTSDTIKTGLSQGSIFDFRITKYNTKILKDRLKANI